MTYNSNVMRKLQKRYYFLFALLVNGCIIIDDLGDDDDVKDDPEAQVMTAKVDGVDFSVVESEDKLIQLDFFEGSLDLNGDYYEINLNAYDFGSSHVTTITLILYGANYSDLKAGSQFGGAIWKDESVFIGAIGGVGRARIGDEVDSGGITPIEGSINVEITKLDKENELISGEFSFVAYDEDNDENIVVTDGVFTNVKF